VTNRLTRAATVIALVLGAVGTAPRAGLVQAQTAPPGNIQIERIVSPLDVAVGDSVHVQIGIEYDNARTSNGVDVFFVVDRTPTMYNTSISRPHPMDITKDALQFFVNSMDFTKCQAGILTYAGNVSVGRNLGDNQDALLQAIRAIRMAEEDDVRGLQAAFRTATQKLHDDGIPGNDKLIIIVVAGPDVGQQLLRMPTVAQAARNAGVGVLFLMFQIPGKVNAAFGHYVDAASDCTWGYCPTWSPTGGGQARQKYAWGVGVEGASDIREVMRRLVEHFMFEPTLARIVVREGFDPASVGLLAHTVVPPPARVVGPPFYEAEWEYDNLTRGRIDIDYDVEVLYPDDTYPVATISQVYLFTTDGGVIGPIDMPNPDLTVHGTGTPTVQTGTPPAPTTPAPAPTTPSATDTPDVTPSPTPDSSPTADTPAPAPAGIYLPLTLRRWG